MGSDCLLAWSPKCRRYESPYEAREVADGTCIWFVACLLTRIRHFLERYADRIVHGDAEFRTEWLSP